MRKNGAAFILRGTALRVLALVKRGESQLSYTDLSEQLEVDRETAIAAVRRLERHNYIVVERGRGTTPNRYIPTDHLLDLPPLDGR